MRRWTVVALVLVGVGVAGCSEGALELNPKAGERANVVIEANSGGKGGLVRTQSKVAALDADVPLTLTRTVGNVKWWSEERGIGFIAIPAHEDVLVKRADVVGGDEVPLLREGESVVLSIIDTERGFRAVDVHRTG